MMVNLPYVSCMLIMLIACNFAFSEIIDYGSGNVLEYEEDPSTKEIVRVKWISRSAYDGTQMHNACDDKRRLRKRDENYPEVIRRYCAGYAVDREVGLRSLIRPTKDGHECNVDGWTTYMIFYAFDYGYGMCENLCVFGCAETFSRVHRAMISIGKNFGDTSPFQALRDSGWHNNAFEGAMADPGYSDPVDIMWAFNGYHRMLLNSLNEPLDYTNEPKLHGWKSSGQILHTLLAVKFDPLSDKSSFNDGVYGMEHTGHHQSLIRHELVRRGLSGGQSSQNNNLLRANGRLVQILSEFVSLWNYNGLDEQQANHVHSLYGGRANRLRNPEQAFVSAMGSRHGRFNDLESIRIDVQNGITTYPGYPGLRFANIQIQYQSDSYARIEVPINMDIGSRRIRRALLEALIHSPTPVRILPTHRNGREVDMGAIARHGEDTNSINWSAWTVSGAIYLGGYMLSEGKGK